MKISFSDAVSLPDDVLVSNLQAESVLLNLDTERYFGLDEIGTRFLSLVTTSENVQAAYNQLVTEFVVDPEVLRNDLSVLLDTLSEHGLLEVK